MDLVRLLPDYLSSHGVKLIDAGLSKMVAVRVVLQRSPHVNVFLAVFGDLENRAGVDVFKQILHPYRLKRVKVEAVENAAVVPKEQVVFPYNSAGLRAIAALTLVDPCFGSLGIVGIFNRALGSD